jgi:hypothetical protein
MNGIIGSGQRSCSKPPDPFGTLMEATDTKYRIKLNDSYWENKRLKDIHHDLDTMFEDVLDEAKKNYADNDLGRVVIHHPSLNDAIA